MTVAKAVEEAVAVVDRRGRTGLRLLRPYVGGGGGGAVASGGVAA